MTDSPSPLVLIVAQDPAQRDILVLALQRQHYRVLTAANGNQALQIIAEQSPSITVLDLFLPQMNGLEVIQHLKQSGRLHTTRIIALSALGFSEVVQQARQAGAIDFLIKPVDGNLLIDRVQQALKNKNRTS